MGFNCVILTWHQPGTYDDASTPLRNQPQRPAQRFSCVEQYHGSPALARSLPSHPSFFRNREARPTAPCASPGTQGLVAPVRAVHLFRLPARAGTPPTPSSRRGADELQVSTALAASVVVSAFHQRANFYSAMVYLAQSNLCLLVSPRAPRRHGHLATSPLPVAAPTMDDKQLTLHSSRS